MFQLSVVSPEKKMATDLDVEEVIVPGHRGQLTIYPGHAPLVTTLQVGLLQYRLMGEANYKSVVVSWGYCEVNPKGVFVLAETAESIEEIDSDRAKRALSLAEKRLMEPDLEPDQIKKYQRKMQRALARLEMNKKQ